MSKYAARDLVLEVDNTPVGQVTAMGEAGSSRDLIDASAYGDGWKDYVLGQQDGSELALTIALDESDSGQWTLIDAYNAASQETFGMSHTDSGFDVTFPAIITGLTRGGAIDGLLQISATLKILNPGVVDVS